MGIHNENVLRYNHLYELAMASSDINVARQVLNDMEKSLGIRPDSVTRHEVEVSGKIEIRQQIVKGHKELSDQIANMFASDQEVIEGELVEEKS
jgi:cytidylate kinase